MNYQLLLNCDRVHREPEAVRTRTHAQVQLYLARSVRGARGHASGTRLKVHRMLTRTTALLCIVHF
jgi:hypothetical protein